MSFHHNSGAVPRVVTCVLSNNDLLSYILRKCVTDGRGGFRPEVVSCVSQRWRQRWRNIASAFHLNVHITNAVYTTQLYNAVMEKAPLLDKPLSATICVEFNNLWPQNLQTESILKLGSIWRCTEEREAITEIFQQLKKIGEVLKSVRYLHIHFLENWPENLPSYNRLRWRQLRKSMSAAISWFAWDTATDALERGIQESLHRGYSRDTNSVLERFNFQSPFRGVEFLTLSGATMSDTLFYMNRIYLYNVKKLILDPKPSFDSHNLFRLLLHMPKLGLTTKALRELDLQVVDFESCASGEMDLVAQIPKLAEKYELRKKYCGETLGILQITVPMEVFLFLSRANSLASGQSSWQACQDTGELFQKHPCCTSCPFFFACQAASSQPRLPAALFMRCSICNAGGFSRRQ